MNAFRGSLFAVCVSWAAVAVAQEPREPPGAHGAFLAPAQTPLPDRGSDEALASYRASQLRLEGSRAALSRRLARARTSRERAAVMSEATELLDRSLAQFIEPWVGTTWEFYGVSEEPGRGTIACGYFVSTLLRDLGLGVERVRLAQQASEYIVKTLSPADRVWRFRTGNVADVLKTVRAQPERWFVIGLDYHVGLLLRLDGGEVLMCHSSYLEPGYALCEDAETALAMQSGYHVVGALFTPDLTRRWLRAETIPTVR